MNKYSKVIATVCVGVAVVGAAAAWSPVKEFRSELRLARKFERMADALNLTADQRTQVRNILLEARDERQRIRAANLNREQKREQLKALRQSTRAKVESVLTPAQRAEAKSLVKERIQARIDRLELAKKAVDATPAQQEQLRAVRETAAGQAREVLQNETLTPEQRREQLKAIRQGARAKAGQILGSK